MASGVRLPDVSYEEDPKRKNEYITVAVDIPGLNKKLFKREATNATIDFKPEERSFSLEVTVDNKKLKKKECFVYSVKCLPAEILTDQQTYYTIRKSGEVMLYLCKKTPASWTAMLSARGLEHAD